MNKAVMHAILAMLDLQGQLMEEGLKPDEIKGKGHEMEDGSTIMVSVRWKPPQGVEDRQGWREKAIEDA